VFHEPSTDRRTPQPAHNGIHFGVRYAGLASSWRQASRLPVLERVAWRMTAIERSFVWL